jgi:hypothetical protein
VVDVDAPTNIIIVSTVLCSVYMQFPRLRLDRPALWIPSMPSSSMQILLKMTLPKVICLHLRKTLFLFGVSAVDNNHHVAGKDMCVKAVVKNRCVKSITRFLAPRRVLADFMSDRQYNSSPYRKGHRASGSNTS